jgi:hypothetical protein
MESDNSGVMCIERRQCQTEQGLAVCILAIELDDGVVSRNKGWYAYWTTAVSRGTKVGIILAIEFSDGGFRRNKGWYYIGDRV